MLPLQVFKLSFRTQRAARFREFPGFVWRGALGNRLRRLACVTGQSECTGCPLIQSCAYPYLFETPPPRHGEIGWLKEYATAPLPFVLAPMHEWEVPEQHTLRLSLTVIGDATRYTPYLILALQHAGQQGLGSLRTRLALERIEQETAPGSGIWHDVYTDQQVLTLSDAQIVTIPSAPEQAELSLLTPTRLRIQGQYMTAERLNFAALFTTLMRRVSLLATCHAGADTQPLMVDYRQLAESAAAIDYSAHDVIWQDGWRRSSRQKSSIPMGGISGRLLLSGQALQPLWPWLWTGQWVHLGKGAAMGLGRYCIKALRD